MGCEFKLVDMDEQLLNDLGQVGWWAVGVADDTEHHRVLMQRDTNEITVSNGLRDHAPGTLLIHVVVYPTEAVSYDMQDCLDYLNGHIQNLPGGQPTPIPNGVRSAYAPDGQTEEWFAAYECGRIEFGLINAAERATVLPDIYWAERLMRVTEKARILLDHWQYCRNMKAILTIDGIRGCTLHNNISWRTSPITLAFIQVETEVAAEQLWADGCSPVLQNLFQKFYWSVGLQQNRAFLDNGALRQR